MPAVSGLFKTYREFAGASLPDIYGERLTAAYKVEVNDLSSGVWVNESKLGEISLRWQELPFEAQLSPVNAIAAGDFDADGRVELILAQNHHTNQVETGLWRGNPGCHLEWRGDHFVTIAPSVSGIQLPNDTKAILVIDVDGDGKQDVLAGQNSEKLLLFRNTSK
ncbi:MAG: hypothetical protein ACJAQT_001423 [Akkermansiaceae bacterium]|jgi:hypothetical protein